MLYKSMEDEVKTLRNRVSSLKVENGKLYNQLMETEKSAQMAMWELQEKYDALEDGANNAYGLYREYKDAEEQGLLIKLPCRTGQTIYAYSEFGGSIVPYTVEGIHIFEKSVQIDCCWYSHDECMDGAEFEPSDFNKTVFLTREEAEEALKGGAYKC